MAAATVASAGISAYASSNASKKQATAATDAAGIQANAANRAADIQLQMFNTIRGDLSPYRGVGTSALPGYYALLGMAPPGGAAAPATTTGAATGTVLPSSVYADNFGGGAPGTLSSGFTGGGLTGAAQPYNYGVATPTVGTPNWTQLLKDRPDVLQSYQTAVNGDPSKGIPAADRNSPVFMQKGLDTPENYAKYWYTQMGGSGSYTVKPWTQSDIDSLFPASSGSTQQPGGPAASGQAPGAGAAAPAFDSAAMQSFLEQTPGYQFAKQQGMQAVDRALSAKGLGGISGSLGKGLARFVTGLADSTYQQQLGNYQQAVGVGQSAANQTGAFGTSAASGVGGSLVGAANASAGGIIGAANAGAAGQVGVANAIGAGVNNASNAYLTSRVLGMYNSTPAASYSNPGGYTASFDPSSGTMNYN